jgi:hypothetical protein
MSGIHNRQAAALTTPRGNPQQMLGDNQAARIPIANVPSRAFGWLDSALTVRSFLYHIRRARDV